MAKLITNGNINVNFIGFHLSKEYHISEYQKKDVMARSIYYILKSLGKRTLTDVIINLRSMKTKLEFILGM